MALTASESRFTVSSFGNASVAAKTRRARLPGWLVEEKLAFIDRFRDWMLTRLREGLPTLLLLLRLSWPWSSRALWLVQKVN
jgi:hypothetical protein